MKKMLLFSSLFIALMACKKDIKKETTIITNGLGGEVLNTINQVVTGGSGPTNIFGYDVDMDGNYAVVTDPGYSELFFSRRGRATIYSRTNTGTTWTELATIKNSNAVVNGNFGIAVAVHGDYVATATNDSIYVFKRNFANVWVQQAALYPKNLSADSLGVSSIDIYGDYMVVGHGSRKVNGVRSAGCVYFFKKTNEKWAQVAVVYSPNNGVGDRFGCSVSIHGNFALIGSRGDYDSNHGGKAYAYINFLGNWNLQSTVNSADVQILDNYGCSVELRGEYAIIGASQISSNGEQKGSAYIFKRTGADWIKQARIYSSDNQPHGVFGDAVRINNNYALVFGDDLHEGAIYTFKRTGSSWNFLRKDVNTGTNNIQFGHALGMDSTRHYVAGDYGFASFGTHY